MSERDYFQDTVKKYLTDLSARKIVPGGGSAAALSGALGAALNLMVIKYSMKPGCQNDKLSGLKDRQQEILETLERLIDDDCHVFRSLMDVLKEKQDAGKEYLAATIVPLHICKESVNSLEITNDTLSLANSNLKSDIMCALHMLKSAFYSARVNVDINLKFIKDKDFQKTAQEDMSKLEEKLADLENKIVPTE